MKYQNLKKIYYKIPEQKESIYQNRYQNEFTRHCSICIKQYGRKMAYPSFLCYTEELFQLQEQIYKNYECFSALLRVVPPVVLEQFKLLSIVDEVKSTNDIEGVKSTRHEIKAILNEISPRTARLASVVNKYKKLLSDDEFPFQTSQDIRDFYDDFIHGEICEDNPSNKLDGAIFRKDSVDIASTSGKTIHQGIFPEEKIIKAMNDTLDLLNNECIPSLVRISLFHYFFAYIHPFYDGNGRTDRFITAYYLGRCFHPLAAIRLSVTIKRQRKKYYDLFELTDSELNCGDMTPFVTGFLSMILESFKDSIQLLKRKKAQLDKYTAKINEFAFDDDLTKDLYYILLQAALFYGQGISIKQLMELTKRSRVTIQARLNKIPADHMIQTKIRNSYYYKLNLLVLKEG